MQKTLLISLHGNKILAQIKYVNYFKKIKNFCSKGGNSGHSCMWIVDRIRLFCNQINEQLLSIN